MPADACRFAAVTVHFDEADPGGILFYGRIHDTGAPRVRGVRRRRGSWPGWDDWFRSDDFIVPIRHAEATLLGPMTARH